MKEKICGHFDLSSVERGTVFDIVVAIVIASSETLTLRKSIVRRNGGEL